MDPYVRSTLKLACANMNDNHLANYRREVERSEWNANIHGNLHKVEEETYYEAKQDVLDVINEEIDARLSDGPHEDTPDISGEDPYLQGR